jgi:tetratricopeptide (TPR) repeat protein
MRVLCKATIRRPLAALCIGLALLPTVALAGPAEDALATARRGAEHFKVQHFYEAAVEFEKAYALDPQDLKNLRYAGRAWQEVGYWDRALVLLERYYGEEKDAALKESILEKLEPLRKASPREKAEALDTATKKFPQAHLEDEAAKAFEGLGDEASLRRAVTLLELARLGAATDGAKDRLDGDLRRVRDKLEAVGRAPVAPKVEPKVEPKIEPRIEPKVEPTLRKVEPRQGSVLRTVMFATGGVLVAGGGVVTWLGRSEGNDANQRAADRKYATYESYTADKDKADGHWTLGVAALGVGAALVVAGLLLPSDSPGTTALQWLPSVSPQGTGMVLAGQF